MWDRISYYTSVIRKKLFTAYCNYKYNKDRPSNKQLDKAHVLYIWNDVKYSHWNRSNYSYLSMDWCAFNRYIFIPDIEKLLDADGNIIWEKTYKKEM